MNLKSPDIIALEEVQDNNGATDDSVIDAENTYNMLLSAIQAAGDRMLARALTANLPAKLVTGDRVYGNDSQMCSWLDHRRQAYVLGVTAQLRLSTI